MTDLGDLRRDLAAFSQAVGSPLTERQAAVLRPPLRKVEGLGSPGDVDPEPRAPGSPSRSAPRL
jgi:hypothetical protein